MPGSDSDANPTTEAPSEGQSSRPDLEALWERLDGAEREAWLRACFFAPEPASPALADACGLDAGARDRLRAHALIQVDGAGHFRMHPAAIAYARDRADASAVAAARDGFLGGVLERAQAIDLAAGGAIFAPDRAHFEAALSLLTETPAQAPQWLFLLDRVATALHAQRELEPARDLLHMALASTPASPGAEQELAVAARRSNLALVLLELGQAEAARDQLELALASAERTLDAGDATLAQLRSRLARVHRDLGNLPRARQLLDAALAALVASLGDDHPSVAATRYNLAWIHEQEQHLDLALPLLEQTLGAEERHLGSQHPSTVATRDRIAHLRARMQAEPARTP